MPLAPKFSTSAFPICNCFTFKKFFVRSRRDWEKKCREGSRQGVIHKISTRMVFPTARKMLAEPRETRDRWPLLIGATEMNGDSNSTHERSPSLVGSLGLPCWYTRFLFCLGCSSHPRTKYFFPHCTCTISIPLSPSPNKLGWQPCWVACLLVCVSG